MELSFYICLELASEIILDVFSMNIILSEIKFACETMSQEEPGNFMRNPGHYW